MKRIFAFLISFIMIISCAAPSFAYGTSELGDDFLSKLSAFSNKLYTLAAEDEDENYTMSPLSVYLALAMLHYAGDDEVKRETEAFTGMSAEDYGKTAGLVSELTRNILSYYGETSCVLDISDSVWLDDGASVNDDVLAGMMKDLLCTAERVPFASDNKAANDKIREFVKEQTRGLIDRDFALGAETLFALINTLYFKDMWDTEVESLMTEKRGFLTADGIKKTDFVKGLFSDGEAAENEVSRYFYSSTAHGFKVKFIVPKDGYTLDDAMTKGNLDAVNSTASYIVKHEGEFNTRHFTRCIFPEFKIDSDTPLLEILQKDGSLTHTLSAAGFDSPLTDSTVTVSDIKHQTVLKVDRKGVEGAAVTIIAYAGTAFDGTIKKYHDFVIDKNFGFIVTDPNDVILFEGKVTDPVPDAPVEAGTSGDANCDGSVDLKDVLVLRRFIAGIADLHGVFFKNALVTGGVTVTMKDVLQLMRIIAGTAVRP
ncbi:MAG: hypothetical protein IKN38_04865 [Clostridia bacterium]|nr:hypothetical protein [Clostridia bacterium]